MIAMRRSDRARASEFAWNVVDTCNYAFLAMTGEDGAPYGVPVNIVREGECIYFHGAMQGRKADCLRRDPRVCLTCVGTAEVVQMKFTTHYTSAMAFGTVAQLTDEVRKAEVMRLLCQRHTPENMAALDKVSANIVNTAVWEVRVEHISGKENA